MKFREDETTIDKWGRSRIQPKEPYRTPGVLVNSITDKEGLDKAYALSDKVYVNGNTLYVAGTSYLQAAQDDLIIPFMKWRRYNDTTTRRAY